MTYPTLQQYNEAFQNPNKSLNDPILRNGSVRKTGMGLPFALCGGFALTYTILSGNQKFAVRCFQKQSQDIQQRYQAISSKLKTLNSEYFVDFEFQERGVRVQSVWYPIVKMKWANGETLGEFFEKNFNKPSHLKSLLIALKNLSNFLESAKIAHGDIQPGNLLVSNEGRSIQLIDYDGMFVQSIKHLGASELGLPNFQHPLRTKKHWDSSLDRFPMILLNIVIRALIAKPDLWKITHSDSESFLFKINDFQEPESSALFKELFQIQEVAEDSKKFAGVCKNPFINIPTLSKFLVGTAVAKTEINLKPTISFNEAQYISSIPILNASSYVTCFPYVGQRIELIGQIKSVKEGTTINGQPYVFLNFGNWRHESVKLSIWHETLTQMVEKPNQSWRGMWVSVVGLLEPPYSNKRFGYTHLSINITYSSQILLITEDEALRRLRGKSVQKVVDFDAEEVTIQTQQGHYNDLEDMDGFFPKYDDTTRSDSLAKKKRKVKKKDTSKEDFTGCFSAKDADYKMSNKQIIEKMKSSLPRPLETSSSKILQTQQKKGDSTTDTRCFIASELYGISGSETFLLRQFRDEVLLANPFGIIIVKFYYSISPYFVGLLKQHEGLRKLIRSGVDFIIQKLRR